MVGEKSIAAKNKFQKKRHMKHIDTKILQFQGIKGFRNDEQGINAA